MRSAVLALLACLASGPPADGAPANAAFVARVGEAIASAVGARMGPGAAVRVEQITVTATPSDGPIEVTPAPDARTGRPSMYSLTVYTPAGPRRIGSAMATAHVEAALVRAARAVTRGDELTEADVVAARGTADGVTLKRLPVIVEVVGARVTRPTAAGAVLSTDVLAVQYSVRSGQQVRLRVVAAGIEASGIGVAAESGRIGTVIRVVNPDSKRTLMGRIVGQGVVEVLHGS